MRVRKKSRTGRGWKRSWGARTTKNVSGGNTDNISSIINDAAGRGRDALSQAAKNVRSEIRKAQPVPVPAENAKFVRRRGPPLDLQVDVNKLATDGESCDEKYQCPAADVLQ